MTEQEETCGLSFEDRLRIYKPDSPEEALIRDKLLGDLPPVALRSTRMDVRQHCTERMTTWFPALVEPANESPADRWARLVKEQTLRIEAKFLVSSLFPLFP